MSNVDQQTTSQLIDVLQKLSIVSAHTAIQVANFVKRYPHLDQTDLVIADNLINDATKLLNKFYREKVSP